MQAPEQPPVNLADVRERHRPTSTTSTAEELLDAVLANVPSDLRERLDTRSARRKLLPPPAPNESCPPLRSLAARGMTYDELGRRIAAEQYPLTIDHPAGFVEHILARYLDEPTAAEQRAEQLNAARSHARNWSLPGMTANDVYATLADDPRYRHDDAALAAIADELGLCPSDHVGAGALLGATA